MSFALAFVRLSVSALIAGALVGCGSSGANAPPTAPARPLSVVVFLPVASLEVGQSTTATAFVVDASGNRKIAENADWTTTTPGTVAVDRNGVVTTLTTGAGTVAASVNGARGEGSLAIVPVRVARIAVAPEVGFLNTGASVQLSAIVLDASNNPLPGRLVTWTSSDPARAAVSATGVVTALNPGAVAIDASSEGITGRLALQVTNAATSVASVSIVPAPSSVVIGDSVQFSAVLKDAAGSTLSNRVVTWLMSVSTGTGRVATLTSNGVLAAISTGTLLVEAVSEGKRASIAVRIVDDVDSTMVVSIADPTENGAVGDTLKIEVSVRHDFALASVVATVGARSVALRAVPRGFNGLLQAWIGRMDLSDLRTGPYSVQVTATDVRRSVGIATRSFKRDAVKGDGSKPNGPRSK